MDRTPRVSVVLPARDARAYVREAVESVLSQTLEDLELICIDDGSRDGTGEELERLAAADRRVKLIRQDGRGLIATLNRGLELARAPFVARMDADDVSLPDRLASQVTFLQRNQGVAAVGTHVRVLTNAGPTGRVLRLPCGHTEIRARLRQLSIHHPTVVFRRDALAAVGGYRPHFVAAEDFDLWLRLVERFELANVPEVLYLYRWHGDQVVFSRIEQQILSVLGAQVSAGARARGAPDPVARLDGRITWEFLFEQGLTRERISREMAQAYQGAVRELLGVGLLAEAMRVADALSERLRGGVIVGRAAAVERTLADWHLERARGRPLHAARSLARAFALRPAHFGLRLARAAGRRLSRAVSAPERETGP